MGRIVFLLEEYSMKVFLEGLMPRLFPGLTFLCIHHQGKQDLERSIPRKLKAWQEPGVRFCIIRDNDHGDCRALKERLLALCGTERHEEVLVRIVCQELEAWYFGDAGALSEEFGREKLKRAIAKARFRVPDAIVQPSRALEDLAADFQKVSGARRMSRRLSRDNCSRSFQVLLEGIGLLRDSMA